MYSYFIVYMHKFIRAMSTVIYSPNAPKPIGPYSQAISYNGLIFLSGQIGIDPKTGDFAQGGIKEQTTQVLENTLQTLKAAGSDMSDVLHSRLYLKSMDDFATVNGIYSTYFKEPYPARVCIQAAKLPKDALVELEVIAKDKKCK